MRHVAIALTLLAYLAAADAQTPAPAPADATSAEAPAPLPDAAAPTVSPSRSTPNGGATPPRTTRKAPHKRSLAAREVANPPNSINGFGLPQDEAKQPLVKAIAKDHTATSGDDTSLNYEVGSPEFLAAQKRLTSLRMLEGNLITAGFRSYITADVDVKHPELRNHPELRGLEAALDAYANYWNLGHLSIDSEADRELVQKRLHLRLKQEIQGLPARGTELLQYAGAYSHGCRFLNDPDPLHIHHNMAKVGMTYVYFVGQTMYISAGIAAGPDGQVNYTAEPILAQEQQVMTWNDGHTTQGVTLTVQETESTAKIFFDGGSMDVVQPDGKPYDATRCPPEVWDD